MLRKSIVSAIAVAAMAAAGPALAQGRGGGHGAGGVGVGAGVGVGNPGMGVGNMGIGADMRAGGRFETRGIGGISETGATTRVQSRLNSRASTRASATAVARASANSVLRGGTVIAGPLTGLTVGSQVLLGGGVTGTVERIVPTSGGFVSNVLVRANGRIVPLPPSMLSLDGSAWTATSVSVNRR